MRMLDNCSLETEQVKTIRDDLNYYLDENQVIIVRLCRCGRGGAWDGRTYMYGRGHGTGGPVGGDGRTCRRGSEREDQWEWQFMELEDQWEEWCMGQEDQWEG